MCLCPLRNVTTCELIARAKQLKAERSQPREVPRTAFAEDLAKELPEDVDTDTLETDQLLLPSGAHGVPRPPLGKTRPLMPPSPSVANAQSFSSPFDLGSKMLNLRQMLGHIPSRWSMRAGFEGGPQASEALPPSELSAMQGLRFAVWFLLPDGMCTAEQI